FLNQLKRVTELDRTLQRRTQHDPQAPWREGLVREAKRLGLSDRHLARRLGTSEAELRRRRLESGVVPGMKAGDSRGAECEAETPYFYVTYEDESEMPAGDRRKVLIIGSGPNRIGQGLEFDYCCVQAALELRSRGYQVLLVNSNPETVSTDYDVSSRLYFEPLTTEDVLNVVDAEKPSGVIVQLGGQTPLNLARAL